MRFLMTGAFALMAVGAAVAVFGGRPEWLPVMFLMLAGAWASWTETEEETWER